MAKPDYSEGKSMAAQAIIDAVKADDTAALCSAMDEYASYAGDMPNEEEKSDEEPKGPSIALLLAKRSAKK